MRKQLRKLATTVLIVLLSLSGPSLAVQPDEVLKDPALEARARALSVQLRCLVCQNQSIDDSNAPLAKDLRVLVRERLVEGDSDRQVMDYVVKRYGEFVLLRPRFGAHTFILWLTPLAILLLAGLFVWGRSRRTASAQATPAPLSTDEKARLDQLIERP